MMPATMNVNRLATYMSSLKAGSMHSLTGFDVTRCNQKFRLSETSLFIHLRDSTSFIEVTKPLPPIRDESFRFRNHREMFVLAKTNTQFQYIIGEIIDVKSIVTDPPHDKNRVMQPLKWIDGVGKHLLIFPTLTLDDYESNT
ncbi:hypothetical protein Bca101_019878 [Brassica carinata]